MTPSEKIKRLVERLDNVGTSPRALSDRLDAARLIEALWASLRAAHDHKKWSDEVRSGNQSPEVLETALAASIAAMRAAANLDTLIQSLQE